MKLYTTLPTTLRPAFEAELAAYRQALAHHDLRTAWAHLERAHILGQRTVGGSFSGEVESDADTELAYVAKGVSGALLLQPNGTTGGDLKFTATRLLITSRDVAMTSTGLTTYTCNFVLDDLTRTSN